MKKAKLSTIVLASTLCFVVGLTGFGKKVQESDYTNASTESELEVEEKEAEQLKASIEPLEENCSKVSESLMALVFNGDTSGEAELKKYDGGSALVNELYTRDNKILYPDEIYKEDNYADEQLFYDDSAEGIPDNLPEDIPENFYGQDTVVEEPERVPDSDFLKTDSNGRQYFYLKDISFDVNGYSSVDYNGSSWSLTRSNYDVTWSEIQRNHINYFDSSYAYGEDFVRVVYSTSLGEPITIDIKLDTNGKITDIQSDVLEVVDSCI